MLLAQDLKSMINAAKLLGILILWSLIWSKLYKNSKINRMIHKMSKRKSSFHSLMLCQSADKNALRRSLIRIRLTLTSLQDKVNLLVKSLRASLSMRMYFLMKLSLMRKCLIKPLLSIFTDKDIMMQVMFFVKKQGSLLSLKSKSISTNRLIKWWSRFNNKTWTRLSSGHKRIQNPCQIEAVIYYSSCTKWSTVNYSNKQSVYTDNF